MTEKNCDILVVGSGLTGIVAAYALSLLGLKIIIIEITYFTKFNVQLQERSWMN